MQRIITRNKFFSLTAALLVAFPLQASAGLLDRLRSISGSGDSTSSTSTSTTTSTSTSGAKTVTYTPTNWSQSLKGDLFLPSSSGKARPVVLLLHGGAWQRGDKSSMSGTGKTLAGRGYAAFSINYRFAPGNTYPAQLQDMQQAIRYLQQHAGEYGLDMNRLAVWGYSAGGHLASLLAVQPASDLPPVRVTIAGAPPSDLAAPEARTASSVKIFMGGSYTQIPALYEQASPRRQVRPGMSPVFLYHGTLDTVVPPVQSDNFAATLKAANVPVELVKLQGKDHSTASGATDLYRAKALAFLDRHINSGAGGSTGVPLPTQPVEEPVIPDDAGDADEVVEVPAPTKSTSTAQRLRDFLSR